MSTLTDSQQKAIANLLIGMRLPSGLGDKENACSVAAINLALSGRLTDDVPDCMSDVIGRWIVGVQDAMPDELRNSARWKELLPLAAGTGQSHEQERLAVIVDWMWCTVLPTCQPAAHAGGFGAEWLHMATEKTAVAAWAAARAAEAKSANAAAWAAARAAWRCSNHCVARDTAWAAAWAAAKAAEAGPAGLAGAAAAWDRFDPCTLLQKLIEVSE